MASSSSSSHFIPSSISQSRSYDVFLSFRGEDTRKTFVDHLHRALLNQGIQTYKDDETLPRGETIRLALFKAIEESRIAVIVFSENYADSSWCLDELAHIVKCMEDKDQVVMPIFYDIDPSDVRKQKGKYGDAFTKHEHENKHKVESWRNALEAAGNLSGWVPKDYANGHEAKCIEDVVATIFNRLPPLITNVDKDLIGIDTRLQDLKSKLKIGSGGVRIIGIWGHGGIGKTTLASAAYIELSHKFKACCLLENIREESSKHGLRKLQTNMISLVLKEDVSVGSEIEGKSMIKRSLCDKSVLVVLDDVDNLKQLEALAGSHDWFGEGSRIIITTRDKHLLARKADVIHELSLLSDVEAIELFSRHAYRKDKPVEDYETLSKDVVSYAGGLPLALKVLGSFLFDKDKDEWKSTLAKLKCIPDVEVMERLKISYDGLKHDEKELFLDIACFMRGIAIDEATTVLDACSFYPGIGVKVLVQKSLIKVSNGRLDMHDLIQEMAHYIVRGDHPDNPEKHSRIWDGKYVFEFCDMGVAAPVLETEVLALREYASEKIAFRFGDGYHRHLPHVIANMKKLRFIDWNGYQASLLPSNFQPTKLGCLMLTHSHVKQLWKGYKRLPYLKILDLTKSIYLEKTPDFQGLPCLERLVLCWCENLKEIHPSIGFHERLILVNMRRCEGLKTFPPIIRMKKLETLNLDFCIRLQKFPDIRSSMDSLVNLHLESTAIEIIPSSVGQFCTNLVYFYLSDCFKLKRIEGNFHRLKRLKSLQLSDCNNLEKLARDFFDEESSLEELTLSIIKSREPTSSASLKLPRFLRKLNLSRCSLRDRDIPSDMSGFLNLQVLDLSRNHFSRLRSNLSQIPCLKFLNLSWCTKLVELPDLPSSIAILKAESCDSLQSVGDLSNYKWLWKVSISRENGNKLIDGERVVHSMLQGNSVADRFMSITLLPLARRRRLIIKLQLPLPHNLYNDFSGFFLCADNSIHMRHITILAIKLEMSSMDTQLDHWEEFDKNPESYKECTQAVYIPFSSLSHTSWRNPRYTHLTFEIRGLLNPKIGLVPKKSKSGDSECWEEEIHYTKTFDIFDSNSSETRLAWSP